MRKVAPFLLAGIVALVVTSTEARAQDTTRKSSAGDVAKMPNFGALIAAINATSATASKLGTLTTLQASNVRFVDASELIKAENEAALNEALERNKAALETLRASLGSNTATASAISGYTPKITAADILAVDVVRDNDIVVYFKKPA